MALKATDAGDRTSRVRRLDEVDLEQRIIDKTVYEDRQRELQRRMLQIQQAYLLQGRRAVLVFEGWDAAGKGGAIRRLTERLDPRAYKVWPIARPSAREQGVHYLYRFWQRLPEPGTIAIFDRSWYGRVLVERTEKLVDTAVWRRAYREINEFERMLTDDGVPVVKIFLHVSRPVQLERLQERVATPYKRWKIAIEDFQNLDHRQTYAAAVDDMLARTSTDTAPWHVLAGNYKWHARVMVLDTVCRSLSHGIDLTPPAVSPQIERMLAKASQRKR